MAEMEIIEVINFSELIRPEVSRLVAISCWRSGAFRYGVFRLVSGLCSPVYVQTELLLADTTTRDIVVSLMAATIKELDIDVFAGGELRGVPFADLLGYKLGKPSVAVRKELKEHGADQNFWIAGMTPQDFKGKKVLLTEDLITDGKSKMVFINGIRNSGGIVQHCLAVVNRCQGGDQKLLEVGVELHYLTTLDEIETVGREKGILRPDQIKEIAEYRADPKAWNKKRSQ